MSCLQRADVYHKKKKKKKNNEKNANEKAQN